VHGLPLVAFVARGDARKLRYLHANRAVTITARAGWDWAAVSGWAQTIGIADENSVVADAPARAALLRDVFTAAGGVHDDWPDYDTTMNENDEQPCSSTRSALTATRAPERDPRRRSEGDRTVGRPQAHQGIVIGDGYRRFREFLKFHGVNQGLCIVPCCPSRDHVMPSRVSGRV